METEVKTFLSQSKNCVLLWKKYLWLIIVFALLGFMAGNMLTISEQSDEYQAVASVFNYKLKNDVFITLSPLVSSYTYCEQAAELINDDFITADDIKEMVEVKTNQTSAQMTIYVHGNSKTSTILVANALAQVFCDNVNNFSGTDSVAVLDKATETTIYKSAAEQSWMIRLGATLLAMLVVIVVLGIIGIESHRIVLQDDFTCDGQLEIIGMIPKFKK